MKPSTRMARLTGTAVLTSSALVACAVPMGPLGVVSGDAQHSSSDAAASPEPTPATEATTAPVAAAAEVNTSGERVDPRALVRSLRAALERPRVDWTSTSAHNVARDRWRITPGTVAPTQAPVTPTTNGESPATETVQEAVETPAPAADTPAVATPSVDVPSVSTPTVETPVMDVPAEPTPEVAAPAVEVPAAEQPEVQPETPVDPLPAEQPESPVQATPAVETPTEVSTPEAPNTDAQAPEAPATESPAAEVPTSQEPTDGVPTDTEPSVGEPTDAVPTDGSPIAEVPTAEAPAAETAPTAETPGLDVPDAQPQTDPAQEPVTEPEAEPAPVAQPEPAAQPEPEVQPVQPTDPAVTDAGTGTNSASGPTVPQTQTPVVPVSDTDSTPGQTPATGAPVQAPETFTPAQVPETVAPEPTVPEVTETPAPTEAPADTPTVTPTETPSTTPVDTTADTMPTEQTTNIGSNTPAGRVAYLHGYQQSQAMCPGGSMAGLVDTAIVAPLVASGVLADGDCTLADMKAANPDTEFLAYLNIGGMQAISGWDTAPFFPSCVDPAHGDQYAVTPNNANVATNSKGYAVYPAFDFITIADQSESYAQACGEHAVAMVTTDSVAGTSGAAPVRFDGVFLDDMAMSPAHGQDMAEVGTWGPWGSDDAYGRAILRTVDTIADAMEAAGSDKVLAGNLGIYSDKQNQVALGQDLADSGNLDWIMREFVIGSPGGDQFGAFYAVEQNADVLAQLSRSTPVVMHQFAVDATTSPSLTGSIGGQCLVDSTPNAANLMWAVDQRRVQDMTLSLATVLTGKESGTNVDMAMMQAQPDCQETAANGSSAYESVTDVSVDESDPAVAVLREALSNPDVVAVGEKDTWYEYTVWRRALSDGRQVWVNYRQEAVVIEGVTIPTQTGIITG